MRRVPMTAALALIAAMRASVAEGAAVDVRIDHNATVVDGGAAVVVSVRARCPIGLELLEGIVTVNQGGSEGEGSFGVPCDGRPRRATATVLAIDFLFEPGEAISSSLLLVVDPNTDETLEAQDSRVIKVR